MFERTLKNEALLLAVLMIGVIQTLFTMGMIAEIVPIEHLMGRISAGISSVAWSMFLFRGWDLYKRREIDLFAVLVTTVLAIGAGLLVLVPEQPILAEVLTCFFWAIATYVACTDFLRIETSSPKQGS